MAAEVMTAALPFVRGVREPWLLVSFLPLVFNWIATWRVKVPFHHRLVEGFDAAVHRRLVASNWCARTHGVYAVHFCFTASAKPQAS